GTLEAKGFEVVGVADADSFTFSKTVVLARADQLALLQAVAEALGVATVSPGSIPSDVDGIVIIGDDLSA
ncbi:MAG TPA: LytR C-terminal domain-containing protein, partial [Acidimicrobiia bacterium]